MSQLSYVLQKKNGLKVSLHFNRTVGMVGVVVQNYLAKPEDPRGQDVEADCLDILIVFSMGI